MADQATYYFGRLNLIAAYEDKRRFLMQGLRSRQEVEVRGVRWSFLDVGETTFDDSWFAYGYLVKYRPVTEEEIARPELGSIVDTPISNLVVAKARFFIHIESGVIAFHAVSGQIDIDVFCDRFKRTFENEYERFFVTAEIQIIQEPYKIFEVLDEFETITKVHIALHPSNPNLSEMWKEIDELIKKRGADSHVETYEAGKKSPSLKISGDKDVIGKIAMAEDGYGKATVKGRLKGKVRTVSTRDNPVNTQAPSDEHSVQDVLAELSLIFKQIFRRFIKPEK